MLLDIFDEDLLIQIFSKNNVLMKLVCNLYEEGIFRSEFITVIERVVDLPGLKVPPSKFEKIRSMMGEDFTNWILGKLGIESIS